MTGGIIRLIRILFVCHGNICRSPMAEFLMKELVMQRGLEDRFEIASAATTDEEIGNPVYPPVRSLLRERGISCEGKTAVQLRMADYGKYDLFIGMDSENLYDMKRLFGGDPENKVSLLLDYTDRPRDVSDPWYTRNFHEAETDIDRGCTALLAHLLKNEEST
ncbi:MAG: hypothetical protein CW335_01310 [Clostridiales bacterium]|nr:hypothetical protein [Clostridiales bacterium]